MAVYSKAPVKIDPRLIPVLVETLRFLEKDGEGYTLHSKELIKDRIKAVLPTLDTHFTDVTLERYVEKNAIFNETILDGGYPGDLKR